MSAEPARDYEPKGQYYKISKGADGQVTLRPVRVPAYVIEERRRAAREKYIKRCVARNRERAFHLNTRSVIFYSMLIALVAFFCFMYIGLQNQVSKSAQTVLHLQTQLSDRVAQNELLQSHLDSQTNLYQIKSKAVSDLGLTQPKKKQIVYYKVKNQDYMLNYQ